MADMVELGLNSADINQPDFGMVPHSVVPHLWPAVLPILEEKGKRWLAVVSEADVYRLLTTGQADLWCGMQSGQLDVVVICMWERHARASYYHICFVGGSEAMKYVSKGVQAIEQFASIMGATEITMDARKGVARLLRRYGYGSSTVRLRKSVKVLWRN